MEKKATRVAYGEYLAELGKTHPEMVVLDADLAEATQTRYFKKAFPDRFFDCGIAEANMVDISAGMSTTGLVPFCSTFAVFAGRCFEQIRNTVCYPKLNVKFAFTHAGVTVGEDGGSHQSVEDIALMRSLPNMTVIVPCDANETHKAMEAALNIHGPVYLRLARLASPVFEEEMPFEVGKVNLLREGDDTMFITCGLMVSECLTAADMLKEKGVNVAVVNAHTIKPFDDKGVQELARKYRKVFTVEEANVLGGLGDAVCSALVNMDGVHVTKLGIQDVFGQSGKGNQMLKAYGIDAESLANAVLKG